MLLLLLLLLFCLLCSLVHIELAAVDLSWDIIMRFGTDPTYQLPKAFYDDFVQVRTTRSSAFWYTAAAQSCGHKSITVMDAAYRVGSNWLLTGSRSCTC
jgi:hypothetical protein